MIKVFNETDTIFETNGEVVLNPTYANVHKEDNGDYYLDLETSIEEDKIKHIEHEEGTTIETTGTTLTDVDTTKENKFISLYGDTQQDSTTGKNLLDLSTLTTQEVNGITITNNGDGSITLDGTCTANFVVRASQFILPQGTYTISANNNFTSSDTGNYISLRYPSTTTNLSGSLTKFSTLNASSTFTNDTTQNLRFTIRITNGTVLNNVKIKPQLESGSSSTSWEPYTNGASPNPDYPQEIHNVSGDNTIEICGKNILPTQENTWEQGGISSTTGTNNSSTTRIRTIGYYKIQNDVDYYVSVQDTNYCFVNIFLYDKNKQYITSYGSYDSSFSAVTSKSINIPSQYIPNVAFMRVSLRNMDNTSTITPSEVETAKPMIEKGETASTYEPYTGNKQLISLGVENLFDKTTATDGKAIARDGNLNNSSVSSVSDYITCNKGRYTINIGDYSTSSSYTKRVVFFDSSKTAFDYFEIGTSYDNVFSFDVPSGTSYLRFQFPTTQKDQVQLTKGSQPSRVSENPIELNKISTYQDYIYRVNDRWYLHKEIGKVVLDGSESWSSTTSVVSGTTRFYTTISTLINSGVSTGNGLYVYADKLKGIGWYDMYSQDTTTKNAISNYNSTNNYHYLMVRLDNTYASTTANFKTWLGSNNIDVYYVLNEATDTEITDTTLLEQLNNFEKMKLYKGITNISITPNDLTPTLKLHYNYMTGGDVVINNNDYIKSNNIIVANTPTGEQAFRITDIEKRKHKIVLKAWHISYDTQNYVIQDSYVVDKTCNQAMDHLNNATDNTSPFTTTSDITTINSYRCVRRSLFEAFNVVLERWGGHFVRDNWNFKIMNSIGQDNGVVVRYAKNLKDIQVNYDWTNVVTKILPVGNDGLLLDEVFLYADIQYDIPYTKVIHFDQNIDDEPYRDEDGNLDEEAYKQALKNDLRTQATAYLQEHYIPQVNYELNANLEKITDIGDTIQVKDERLGIDLLTNLISYDYDCILEKYKTLEFGNFRKTISDLTTYINAQTTQIVDDSVATTRITLQNELETATSQIWGVLGNSYVIVEGDKILIVDSLPKETATNVWMFNNGGLAFSNTGINGTFKQAWTIDGTFNTQNINVINFTADLIKGGTLKLGSNVNQNGILEVYDEANNLIALLNKDGLRMNAVNGDYVLINQNVGFAGFDRNDNKIYWADGDEFHMKKSVVEEEITLVDKMRIIPITITENNIITHDGIGFVSTL